MKISVNIAVYNSERYVGEAINSILAQDAKEFECVIVDDGSTDGTAGILAGYTDPRLRIVTLPVNCGIATARNVALRCSSGEYVAVMDADDIAFPGRLSAQAKHLDEHPDIHILGARTIRINESVDHLIDRPQHPLEDAAIKARLLLLNGSAMIHPASMMRMEFIREHNLMYAPIKMSVDHAFWIKCVARGAKFQSIPQELLYKRRHQTNITLQRSTEEHSRSSLRMELLGMYFPDLTVNETKALSNLMENVQRLTLHDLCAGIVAGQNAMKERRSFFGEGRSYLNAILHQVVIDASTMLSKR